MDFTDSKYKEVRAFANDGDRSRHDAQSHPEKKRRLDNEDSQQLGGSMNGNAINTNSTLAAMLGSQYHHHNQKAVDGDAVSSPGFESIRK